MRRAFGLWIVLIAVGSAGCARNVGNRVGAVKDDQARFAALLAIEAVEPAHVFAKSTSVSSAAIYAGTHSVQVQLRGIETLRQLGYTVARQRSSGESAVDVICHEMEPGRSVTLNRHAASFEVMFRVSGWDRDREDCPGRTNAI